MTGKGRRASGTQASPHWLMVCVAFMLLGYGISGPLLNAFGSRAVATVQEVRREPGGHVADHPNDYFWNVSFGFTTNKGSHQTGLLRVRGNSYSAAGYAKGQSVNIYYWSKFPWIAKPVKESQFGWGNGVILVLSAFLLWASAHSGRSDTKRKRKQKHTISNSSEAGSSVQQPYKHMDPEQTLIWLRNYRRHSAWYAGLFLIGMIVLVLCLVWWELGELNQDVVGSVVFFSTAILLLTKWSRNKTHAKWKGRIVRKWIQPSKASRQERSQNIRYTPMLEVETGTSGKKRLRISNDMYDHFQEGDWIVKTRGFDFPEKVNLPVSGERVCICCGSIITCDQFKCDRCKAPVPDHSTLIGFAQSE